jgi:hypothetical protein
LIAALVLAAAVTGAPDAPFAACVGPRTRAQYMMPTERYPHGAYGDVQEWGGLLFDGEVYAGHVLDRDAVFEDIAPRLADFDGDCVPEVVTVESHETEGPQLAIYSIDRGRLRKIAATPHIGRRFALMTVAGIADFNRDGDAEVALLREPDGAGVLEFWGFAPGGLTRLAAAGGFSNHRFGDPALAGGVRDCGAGPELVLADADWTRVLVARLDGSFIDAAIHAESADPDSFSRAMACN